VTGILVEYRAGSEKVLQKHLFRAGLEMTSAHGHGQVARSVLITDPDETAALDGSNGHLRHRGDAHIRRNHRQNGRELPTLKDDVRGNAGFSTSFNRAIAKTMAFFKQQEAAFFGDLFESDHLAPRKLMGQGNNQKERLAKQLQRNHLHSV